MWSRLTIQCSEYITRKNLSEKGCWKPHRTSFDYLSRSTLISSENSKVSRVINNTVTCRERTEQHLCPYLYDNFLFIPMRFKRQYIYIEGYILLYWPFTYDRLTYEFFLSKHNYILKIFYSKLQECYIRM